MKDRRYDRDEVTKKRRRTALVNGLPFNRSKIDPRRAEAHQIARRVDKAVELLAALASRPAIELVAAVAGRTVKTAEASTLWPEGVVRLDAAGLVRVGDVVELTAEGRRAWLALRGLIL